MGGSSKGQLDRAKIIKYILYVQNTDDHYTHLIYSTDGHTKKKSPCQYYAKDM